MAKATIGWLVKKGINPNRLSGKDMVKHNNK
jgi:hypothetical protein